MSTQHSSTGPSPYPGLQPVISGSYELGRPIESPEDAVNRITNTWFQAVMLCPFDDIRNRNPIQKSAAIVNRRRVLAALGELFAERSSIEGHVSADLLVERIQERCGQTLHVSVVRRHLAAEAGLCRLIRLTKRGRRGWEAPRYKLLVDKALHLLRGWDAALDATSDAAFDAANKIQTYTGLTENSDEPSSLAGSRLGRTSENQKGGGVKPLDTNPTHPSGNNQNPGARVYDPSHSGQDGLDLLEMSRPHLNGVGSVTEGRERALRLVEARCPHSPSIFACPDKSCSYRATEIVEAVLRDEERARRAEGATA